MLGFKFIHQLEAADAMFALSLLANDMEKAQRVDALGEKMAWIRCGEGKVVADWRRRKTDPVIYAGIK